MSYTWKTEGFILKRIPLKEVDRLYTLYTKDNGKIVVVATGIRKIHSKLAGHSEPFMLSSFFLARGKYIDRLAGSRTRKAFKLLRSEIDHMHVAQHIGETIDTLVKEHDQDTKLYDALMYAFDFLDERKRTKAELWLFILMWRLHLTKILGFQPELSVCAVKKDHIKEECFFEAAKGGIVCPQHCGKHALKISQKLHTMLQLALEGNEEALKNMKTTKHEWKLFAHCINTFFDYNSSFPLKSSIFLPQILFEPAAGI